MPNTIARLSLHMTLLSVLCSLAACSAQSSGDTDTLLSRGRSSILNPCTNPVECGQNSGLVPFKKDAIHSSLIWTKESECPKMLMWMRPSEYMPMDYLNPTVNGVFSGFKQTYIDLVQGGFNLTQLDRSGWSRYAPDLARENTQLVDVCGLQSLIDTGAFTKTSFEELTGADMALSDPYFRDAGYSRGLGQNLFCAGHVAGADGRIYVVGGHDKAGNNGIDAITIFDPETERWVPRSVPCVRSQFAADPTGTAFDHCSALNEANTDPPDPSDMEYQRWYPTSVLLPNSLILALSGTDQDTSVGPELASATKVRQQVPEIYDPRTDRTIALKNAQKLLPMYPRTFVRQKGPGKNDWDVCVTAETVDPLPGTPGGANITGYDPFHYRGHTSCLNVQAALADPSRDVLAFKHWQFIDTAANAHDSGAGVQLTTIHADGTWTQKVYLFGGNDGVGAPSSDVAEMIDFAAQNPHWQQITPLNTPTRQNNAVILPTGQILVVGGRDSLTYQMYKQDGSRKDLITSWVPRYDHSTALLMKRGNVWVMGGNRVNLLPENEDLAVPVLEDYRPPYLFKGPQPVIEKAPHKIRYGQLFKLDVSNSTGEISSVALLRTGPVTHNWAWGNYYVKLPFVREHSSKLRLHAPSLPGLALPGEYMLFVVNEHGVPSEAAHLRLEL